MLKSLLSTIGFILLTSSLIGQSIVGTIKGTVVEEGTLQPLEGIAVMLSPFDSGTGVETDSMGRFEFAEMEVGLFDLAFISLTHTDYVLKEVWVRSGKETAVEIELKPLVYQLSGQVEVVRSVPERIGTRSFTVEQSLRYAATFSDPARLVTAYPGVAAVNDQANHISVRGNNPNANKWLIEGMEIVSPNHLSTAGTPNDLPTLSGGGVNMLSTQMLRRSSFHNGVLPGDLSNATGGIMDMRLRKGNDTETEWTAQAGLIGIDLASEGPLSKKNRSSYLVNYRYSTLGLLSAMGVDLSDERIRFQDLSLHLNFPVTDRFQLKVFGLGGMSNNELEAEQDTALWEFDSDSTFVDHDAHMVALGTTMFYSISDNTTVEFGAIYSSSEQERKKGTGDFYEDEGFVVFFADNLNNRKLTSRMIFRTRHSNKWTAQYGVTALADKVTAFNQVDEFSTADGIYARPFMIQNYRVNDKLSLNLGLAYATWSLSNDAVIEPTLEMGYRVTDSDRISLRVGQRAQTPDLHLIVNRYPADSLIISRNNYDHLGFTRSNDVVLGYDHQFSNGLSLRCEGFYQKIMDIPGSSNDSLAIDEGGYACSSSLFNNWNSRLDGVVENDRSAQMVGGEISVSQSFRNNTFYNGNVSVFESTYGGDEGTSASSRWDIGYTANLSGGKEFVKKKERVTRTWGITGRLNFMGGAKYTPEVIGSNGSVTTEAPFSGQYDQFYRLDLRVYLKTDKEKKTGMWSLDLQNATNAMNGFYDYYDTRKDEVITKYQLGIIPNFSYRLEF